MPFPGPRLRSARVGLAQECDSKRESVREDALHQRVRLGVGPHALFLQPPQRGGAALQQRVSGAPHLVTAGGVAAGAGSGRRRCGVGAGHGEGPLGQGGGARACAQAGQPRMAQRQDLLLGRV